MKIISIFIEGIMTLTIINIENSNI